MAWVDTTYVDAFIGETQRQRLFADTAGTYSAAVFAQYELGARATVISVMAYAGYPAPSDTLTAGLVSTAFLQKLLAAVMVRDAYGTRKGIRLAQEASDAIAQALGMLDAVYAKKLPIPGLEPASKDGYGGVQFSPTSGESGRPRAFNLRGTGF